jgi:UDP-N-acetylmuramate--alanine ligase
MKPTIAVITNIEADHLDYYKDLDEIKQTFREFIELVPVNGLVVACGDDMNVREVLPSAKSKVITFGFNQDNDIQAKIATTTDGKTQFKIGNQVFALKLPGKHLILDALAAIIVARHLGVEDDVIKTVLADYSGAKRRFEILGEAKGITFVDDYGHHPTEIQAFLSSAREFFTGRKIRVVFQAHQYSRTRLLLEDFAKSFVNVDEVLVAPILPVRDSAEDLKAITTKDLVNRINTVSNNAKLFDSFDAISAYLKSNLQNGDIVLSVGAGKNSDWINDFYHQFKLGE